MNQAYICFGISLTLPSFAAFCMSLMGMHLSIILCVPYTYTILQEQHDLLSQGFKQGSVTVNFDRIRLFLTHVAPNSSRDFPVTPGRIVPSNGGVAISESTFVQRG